MGVGSCMPQKDLFFLLPTILLLYEMKVGPFWANLSWQVFVILRHRTSKSRELMSSSLRLTSVCLYPNFGPSQTEASWLWFCSLYSSMHKSTYLQRKGKKLLYHNTHYCQVNWKTFWIRFKVVMVRIEQLETKNTQLQSLICHTAVFIQHLFDIWKT